MVFKFNWKYIIAIVPLLIIILFLYKILSNKKEPEYKDQNDHFEPNNNIQGEIVLYYAIWCGFSRQFLPEWKKFTEYAKKNFPQLKVKSIRCENDFEEYCIQKDIAGYPTVILYPVNGTEIQFTGERSFDKLVEFINKNT